jgi:beta-alanine degradation protein BauB
MKNLIVAAIFAATISFAAAAQDAVTTDAKHYKVVLENEYVRVLRVNYGVKEKSMPHQHPDAVAIMMTPMQGKFTLADGKTEDRKSKAGDVLWTPAVTHTPENTGGKPFEVILVELKARSPGGTSSVAAADDPLKVAPEHHKLEFENDRVRVIRGSAGPGEKSAMHGHPANVVILLTDVRVGSTSADGKSEETTTKAGEVIWREPLKHASDNRGDKPFEVVIVEIKGT